MGASRGKDFNPVGFNKLDDFRFRKSVVVGGGFVKTSRAVAHRLLVWWERGGDGRSDSMGVVVLETPHPGARASEKGGAGTAGTGMQRSSPAAQGERGSQRCAKLERERQRKKNPSLSHKVEIRRLIANTLRFSQAMLKIQEYILHMIYLEDISRSRFVKSAESRREEKKKRELKRCWLIVSLCKL